MRYLLILLMCLSITAQTRLNSTGWKDTSLVDGFAGDTVLYSKSFILANHANKAYWLIADDSSSAGLSGDSVSFAHGYQLGFTRKVIAASGNDSTYKVWGPHVLQDSCNLDSVISPTFDNTSGLLSQCWVTDYSTGTITSVPLVVDTASIPGWIYQWYTFSPPWAHHIRFWAAGLAANKKVSKVKLIFGYDQRHHQEAR